MGGLASQACYVSVVDGWEGGTDDLLSCSHCALQGLTAECCAAAIPHSEAAGQDALNGPTVEGEHDGDRGSGVFQSTEKVEALPGFLVQ